MNHEQQKYFKRITGFELLLDPQSAYNRGVVPALVLQQLRDWITTSTANYDGVLWVNPKKEDWESELPYIPHRKIQACIRKLLKEGVIESEILKDLDGADIFYTYPARST